MRTGSKTTYIFLEKGSEDVALYEEITKLFQEAGITDGYAVREFRTLWDIRTGLRGEIYDEED